MSEVERIVSCGLPRDDLHRELAARLRRGFHFDAACWHGLDPDTLLLTTANPEELHEHGFLTAETEPLAAQSVISSEYARDDVNTFSSLARRRVPVGILSDATRGRPDRSPRFVDFLSPRGTPHEMRAVFRARGRAWGCVVLHRTADSGEFTRSDARLLARLARPIAEGIRLTLRLDAARRTTDAAGPGLVVLNRWDEPEFINEAAERFLAALRTANSGISETVPFPVRALSATTRRSGRQQTLAIHSAEGWLSLTASLPLGQDRGRVAVVAQPVEADSTALLVLETFGLTRRELEVTSLVLKGRSTKEISEQLVLSPWTVQDHLKSIFEKTGTHSRGQLRLLVFMEDYMPDLGARTPLDADGHLVRG